MNLLRTTVLLGVSGLLALLHGLFTGTDGSILENDPFRIGYTEAISRNSILWVDARSESDFLENHYSGAIHLNEDNWDSGLSGLLFVWEPEATIVVYCDGAACATSRKVAERLREELDSDSVFWLEDGWEGFPEEVTR